jgi:DNA-binding response OmpR family regulator
VRTRPTILFFSPEACPVPALVRQWAEANAFPLAVFDRPGEVEAIVLRGHPCLLFVDGNGGGASGVDLVRRLKLDAFTAIVPVTVLSADHQPDQVQAWFGAGADEVVTGLFSPAEQRARLDAMLVRTERDVSVHPSTRLPGTTEIAR